MKKVFTSILLLAALVTPFYLSASGMLSSDNDGQGGGDSTMIEVDYTSKLGIDAASWNGSSGLCATQFAPAITTKDGRTAQLAENYQTNVDATGDLITQTVSGLANGTYRVSIYANAFFTSGRGFNSEMEDGSDDVCYVFAGSGENRVQSFITARIATSTTENDLRTLNNVKVTDGTLVVGLGKAKAGTNWHTVQVYEITAIVNATDLLNTANGNYELVNGKPMDAIVAQQLAAAKSAVDSALTTETLNAYTAAVDAAQASANVYAPLTAVLAEGDAIKANVSDDDAKAAYDNAIIQVKSQYEAGTISDAAAAIATVEAALPALAKAQTAENSDFTRAIVNYAVNGADGWTCDRPKGGNGPLLGGTSFEYWAGNANPRAEASFDYYQEITGLPNGLYTVSAEMYNSLNGEDGAEFVATSGVYAISGETEVAKLVDVDGTELIRYTTDQILVKDGTLRIGVKSTVTPIAARWFVADNFKLTLVKALDETELAYESALASIEDGGTYRVFAQVDSTKYYLNSTGFLVTDVKKAATFTFNAVKVSGTLYPTGWNLGCKFTNPSLTNGASGDVVQNGQIMVGGNDRNDWERQVFFLKDGQYKVRATNANSANWGANTYWAVVLGADSLPQAGYVLAENADYQWQLEANVDNRPAAFSQVQTWAGKLQAIEGLVTEATQWSSNAKDPSEGSYAALVDGDYTTFFHSTWHASNDPGTDHYLQAELPEAQQEFYFYFKKRSQNNNNRPTDILIQGSNDGETFTDITEITEGLPTGAAPLDYTSAKISAAEAYKYIRFTVKTTSTGQKTGDHVYFTASEWYILPINELTDAAVEYMAVAEATDLDDEDVEPINSLATQIDAAYQVVLDAEAIASTKAEILEVIAVGNEISQKAKQEDMFAQSDVETNLAAMVTLDDFKAGLVTVKQMVYNYVAAIGEAPEDIDITKAFIVNPTPVANNAMAAGWEGDNFGSASDGVSEYWNKAAAGFHQTINLPAGDYKLTVVALQRTGMTGYVYAGDAQTTIAQATSEEANSRSQAAAWFAAGNGVNEVKFTVAEAGDITIGLKADEATGDHWTVWQSFKLELAAPVQEVQEKIINIERYNGLGYTAQTEEFDAEEAKTFLGVDSLTYDMLRIVNPDSTEISNYAPYDGWFNGEGFAETWGDNTKVCVKFFQVIPNGTYEICDMNGADVVDSVYTVKWALVNGHKKLVYNINVKFVEVPPVVIEISENIIEASVSYETTDAIYTEKTVTLTADQVSAICNELGIDSLGAATVLGYNPTTQELVSNYAGFDGWRDANGDFHMWTGDSIAPACVKFYDGQTFYCYNIAGLEAQSIDCYWAIATETKAVLVKITFNYIIPVGIKDMNADEENATIYDLSGRKVSKIQKGGIYIVNGKKVSVK